MDSGRFITGRGAAVTLVSCSSRQSMDSEQELPEADVAFVVHVVVRKDISTDGARVLRREEQVEPGHKRVLFLYPQLLLLK